MSEGGLLSWKRQKLKLAKAADYSEIQKPLPNPPEGYQWKFSEDKKEWSLELICPTLSSLTSQNNVASKEEGHQGFHQVLRTDTIQGICLKYNVSPYQLRKRNHFTGDNLFSAPEVMVIPNHGRSDGGVLKDADDKNVKVSKFLVAFSGSLNSGISRKEAIAYLDMNDWDVSKAINDAKDDLSFEKR